MANKSLPGGGGGDDSTDDSTTGRGDGNPYEGGTGASISWDVILAAMPKKVAAVLTAIAALSITQVTFVTSLFSNAKFLANFADHPARFVRGVIESFLFDTFLKPIATSVFDAGRAVVGSILFIGFGGDGSLGIAEGSSIGLLDIPWLFVNPVLVGVGEIYGSIGNFITQVNKPIIDGLTSLGLAAPIVTPVLLATEVSLLVWATWVVISTIDVPLVKAQSMATAITGPLRRAIRWLIG